MVWQDPRHGFAHLQGPGSRKWFLTEIKTRLVTFLFLIIANTAIIHISSPMVLQLFHTLNS